jgi:hypothetical protein
VIFIKAEAEYEAATRMAQMPMAIVMMPSEFVTAATAIARAADRSAG